MPKTLETAWIVVLLGLGLALAAGCGDDGTTTDAGDDRTEASDDAGDVDVLTETDTAADVPADVEPDVPADAPADVEPDVPADTPTDVEPDLPPDVPADTPADIEPDLPPDVPADEGPDGDVVPGELRVTMTSSDAWANLMPGGSSSHAIFTLEAVNGGTSDVTGLTAIDGQVSLAAGGTAIFSFTDPTLTRSGGGAFDGTIPAGTTVTLDGNGVSRTASGSYCDSDVKVMVRVTWDGGPASRELTGDTISLMCVY